MSSGWSGPVALAAAATFTGAAVFCTVVEHPARLQLDDQNALAQWKPSFKRAAVMQSVLAVTSAVAGFKAAKVARGQDARWIWGSGLMATVLPYTVITMMSTNKKLLDADKGNGETTDALIKWGKLHAVRSVLGLVATGAYMCGLAKPL